MLITAATNKINNNTSFISVKTQLYELLRLCLPLMLSALSGTLMIFLDRIILAKYNTQAMNAAITAANIVFIFHFTAISIAMIAEVFVGQSNGASQFKSIGKPVWQMIWFSIFSGIIMIPIGLFGGPWFLPMELLAEGEPYFCWMMIFGPTFPLVAALSAFFIGRKKVRIVTALIVLGNILHLIIALILVFGIPSLIEPMGTQGAAIATGISETCIALGLFFIFLNARNRTNFHSHHWKFDYKVFLKCIHVALPNAFGHMIATSAWATLMCLLAKKSLEHITVITIGLSIWMLFSFVTDALQKGVSALAANSIGAKEYYKIKKILKTGILLQCLLSLLLAIPLVIFPELLVNFFIPLEGEMSDITHLRELITLSCYWLWVAFLFDGMAWVVDGILTAAGDTRFVMFMNSIGTWLLCILPVYMLVVIFEGSPIMTLQIITVFCLILFFSYYLRYKSNRWKQIALISY